MITTDKKNPIFDYSTFVNGLMCAARGVGLLTETEAGNTQQIRSSSWLITDDLVVVPGHMILNEQSTFLFAFQDAASQNKIVSIKASPVKVTENPPVRLLRLENPLANSGLSLELSDVKEIHDVYVLHFPGGQFPLKLSTGRIKDVASDRFFYDASTERGSGGGPVFTTFGKVIGTHLGSTPKKSRNEGASLHAMFQMLRSTSVWNEIAAYHKIAITTKKDIKSSEPVNEDLLLKAAVQWNFKKDDYSDNDQKLLSPLVINSSTSVWSLKPDERQRIIRNVKSKKQLSNASKLLVAADTSAGQQVINNILSDAPHKINDIPDKLLPYWLQAVRWFSDTIPTLPSTEDINRELQKRRTRANLEAIAGPEFIGREDQLKKLRKWVQTGVSGPMVVSGIGGIGKSSLISKFILGLPQKLLVLWLDFDRADLAPDDAGSILRLIQEQLSVRVKNYKPIPIKGNWQKEALAIGSRIATEAKKTKTMAPVLIMDGFEVAQHARRYHEIWPVLEKIMTKIPRLHVIVSGRAPVNSLTLRKRKAEAIELTGMDAKQTRAWLSNADIINESDINRIIELTDGVPLKLKLIVRYLKDGNPLSDLAKINSMMLEGYLYHRILDRVIDPMLKEIAQDVLIVRLLNGPMISSVFADRIPKDLTAEETFQKLLAELGLVTEAVDTSSHGESKKGPTTVNIRPEVRTATLKLLEHDNPNRVREIDTRAVAHYGSNISSIREISECIYHNLRLGNIDVAEGMWQPECAKFLAGAINDLPESLGKAKGWLAGKLERGSSDNNIESWEIDALSRIKVAVGRNAIRTVKGILNERADRSNDSPLLIYDAWILWKEDHIPEARKLLDRAPVKPTVEFDRAILRAYLAVLDDEPEIADEILDKIERGQFMLPAWDTPRLLIRGARLQLNTNLWWELDLLAKLKKNPQKSARLWEHLLLTESDAVVPELANILFPNTNDMRLVMSVPIPQSEKQLGAFVHFLNDHRAKSVSSGRPIPLQSSGSYFYDPLKLKNIKDANDRSLVDKINNLAVLGWKRAMLITSDVFLWNALSSINRSPNLTDRNFMALLASLVSIRGIELDHSMFGDASGELIDLNVDKFIRSMRLRPSEEYEERFHLALKFLGEIPGNAALYSREMLKKISNTKNRPQYIFFDDLTGKLEKKAWRVILYSILAPSCLEVLAQQALGITNEEPLHV